MVGEVEVGAVLVRGGEDAAEDGLGAGLALLGRVAEAVLALSGELLAPADQALPAPLDVMSLGKFEPDAWIPSSHPAARQDVISLGELTRLAVVHGPRRVTPGIYDAWLASLRSADSRFEFADPPFRQSLPLTLACAAAAGRPTAVLTGPRHLTGERTAREDRAANGCEMVRVRLDQPAYRDRRTRVERRPAIPVSADPL